MLECCTAGASIDKLWCRTQDVSEGRTPGPVAGQEGAGMRSVRGWRCGALEGPWRGCPGRVQAEGRATAACALNVHGIATSGKDIVMGIRAPRHATVRFARCGCDGDEGGGGEAESVMQICSAFFLFARAGFALACHWPPVSLLYYSLLHRNAQPRTAATRRFGLSTSLPVKSRCRQAGRRQAALEMMKITSVARWYFKRGPRTTRSAGPVRRRRRPAGSAAVLVEVVKNSLWQISLFFFSLPPQSGWAHYDCRPTSPALSAP